MPSHSPRPSAARGARRTATATGAVLGLALGLVTLPGLASPASADPATPFDALQLGVSSCSDTAILLEESIDASGQSLDIPCNTTLFLADHDLVVQNVRVHPGSTLTVTDSGSGRLIANAAAVASTAGIATTGAAFVASGSATIIAIGGADAAGIGGDQSAGGGYTEAAGHSTIIATGGDSAAGIGGGASSVSSGGTLYPAGAGGTTLVSGGTVTASGGYTAIGTGRPSGFSDDDPDFGSLDVDSGSLLLGSDLVVPDNTTLPGRCARGGHVTERCGLPTLEVVIGPTGVIASSSVPARSAGRRSRAPVTPAILAGPLDAGQIENGGAITLPAEKVTGDGVTVFQNHFEVSFDTAGGGGTPTTPASIDPITVFAPTFDAGVRTLPTPTRGTYTFAGWRRVLEDDRVDADTYLGGLAYSSDGQPAPIAVRAIWTPGDSPLGGLVADLDTCTTTDHLVTLDGAVDAPMAQLEVACDTTLDLAGHDVSVASITVDPGVTLTVTDEQDGASGTLITDATDLPDTPGLRTTGATFVTTGRATVISRGGESAAGIGGARQGDGGTTATYDSSRIIAYGGLDGAGIGGGYDGDGGATSTHDTSTISATGAARSAGIGGGSYGEGGNTRINQGSTVTARGGYSAIGSGVPADPDPAFGSLRIYGSLYLRSDLVVGNDPDQVLRCRGTAASRCGGPTSEVLIGADGVLAAHVNVGRTVRHRTPVTSSPAVLGGDVDAGQIDNGGAIVLPTGDVTGHGVAVIQRHYAVSFDTDGGTLPEPVGTVTVFASSFASGDRTFPVDPTRAGYTFTGWAVGQGVSRTPSAEPYLTATSDLTLLGASDGSAPLTVNARATWSPLPSTDPPATPQIQVATPTLVNTTSAERGAAAPAVGDTMSTTAPTTDPIGATLSYTWTRTTDAGTRTIAGATGSSYTLVAADLGARVRLTVSATATGYLGGSATAATGVVQGAPAPGPLTFAEPGMIIHGTAAVGRTLTTTLVPVPVPGQVTTYQWQRSAEGSARRSDTVIIGATRPTYVVRPDDVGRKLVLVVTRTAPGYLTRTDEATTATVAPGTLRGRFLITGRAAVDRTLTASRVARDSAPPRPAGYVLTYHWNADGTPLHRDATMRTYEVPPRLAGAHLTVTVTATAPGYTTRTTTSRSRRIAEQP